MKDIFGRILELWDIIAVVSANEKLELALIVGSYDTPTIGIYNQSTLPIIRRFSLDGSIRERETVFNHCETRSLLLVKDAVPYECLKSKQEYLEIIGVI